jgi:hypothetical protein
MQQTNKRQHYVGVAPRWLLTAIEKNGLPIETLLSYEKLSTIASPEDVCFYDQYLRHSEIYIGKVFSDFTSVRLLPQNRRWLENYSERFEVARVTFESTIKRLGDKLSDSSVPMTVRRYTYEPVCIGLDTLFFVPSEDVNTPVPGTPEFFEKALDALAKQLNVTDLQRFDVYQSFCTV